jgi:RNase H-fold protein (predicted Holliday junction resolvase)
VILGIDPGREKTGLAVIDGQKILWHVIIRSTELIDELRIITKTYSLTKIALGDSTSSQDARTRIEEAEFLKSIPLQIVVEKNSTLEARSLYFEANPPTGLKKLIPLSLQTPPVNIDDFAAAVIARRAL